MRIVCEIFGHAWYREIEMSDVFCDRCGAWYDGVEDSERIKVRVPQLPKRIWKAIKRNLSLCSTCKKPEFVNVHDDCIPF